MPNTAKGTPYVQSSDLVSAYPTVSLSLANHIDNNLAYNAVTYNNQVGTTYTFVLADASTGRIVTASNAAAQTYTVPPQTSVAWDTGARIFVTNIGTGALSIAPGAGVTVSNTAAAISQWESVELIRTASDVWAVVRGGLPTSSSPALAYVNTTTFSASSGINVNSCFTSAYDNYRIILSIDSNSTANRVDLRMRAAGVDNSSNNYAYNGPDVATSSTAAVATFRSSGLISAWQLTGTDNNGTGVVTMDIHNPNRAFRTSIIVATITQNATDMRSFTYGGMMSVTTAYDGFSLLPSTGTVTGTVRIYGYRNA